MTVEALKSASITNNDATPQVFNATGVGGEGYMKSIADYFVPSAAASTTSTYRTLRVPTNCKVQSLMFESEAQGAGKFNLSVYYSDDVRDGTTAANNGVIVPTTGDAFFASDIDCASAVQKVDYINESGNNPPQNRNLPLWKALGLTSDPGGKFDIVAVCHTTAITTGLGKVGMEARFVM